jgi:hypothetical protein
VYSPLSNFLTVFSGHERRHDARLAVTEPQKHIFWNTIVLTVSDAGFGSGLHKRSAIRTRRPIGEFRRLGLHWWRRRAQIIPTRHTNLALEHAHIEPGTVGGGVRMLTEVQAKLIAKCAEACIVIELVEWVDFDVRHLREKMPQGHVR